MDDRAGTGKRIQFGMIPLILVLRTDAASAAFQVGYESPSHFSRDYSCYFGAPPGRDIEGLRQKSMLNVRLHT